MTAHLPALQRKLSEIVGEYDTKSASIEAEVLAFEKAGDRLKMAACVGGTWGDSNIDTGSVYASRLEDSLRKSAWRHVYDGLNIEIVAPASDKSRFKQAMSDPPPFTIDNIRATFGAYIANPMGSILRGLAEVFCSLDQAYKSHDKVKIGVNGLPKRIIISQISEYSGWGRDRLQDAINALAAYQGKPLVDYQEISALVKDGNALIEPWTYTDKYDEAKKDYPGRGVWLKRYGNGNGHLYFGPEALRDINRALAEYYGDVLPDCSEAKPEQKRAGTDVAKDLQYYATPQAVVDRVLDDVYPLEGQLVLEPSCGCGRFMDGIRAKKGKVFGIEVDPGRAQQCRDKGHNVLTANFLEVEPVAKYARVVMNPPFYGTHYAKHVNHALKFLKPDGKLTAILPATARYDHGLVDGRWSDLPVGSFSESGTNINTTVLTIFK